MKEELSYKSINKLAIPAILAGIAEPILSATDTAVIGNIPVNSTESLAAVGIVGTFLSMLIWVLSQTRSSISSIISQYIGANKFNEITTLPAQAITLNIVISIFILITTIPIISFIFSVLGAKGLVLDYAIDYYSIRVWGFPLTLLTFAIFGIFRGLQNTFWPMVIAIIGVIINIFLDYALVYGIGFIPAMGLKGAAWASLIAQFIMALISVYLLLTKTRVNFKIGKEWHPEMNRLISMSINLFVRATALNLGLLYAMKTATELGDSFTAAHTVAMQLWLFTTFFIDGYSSVGNIRGGKYFGAKRIDYLKKIIEKLIINSVLVSAVLMIIGILFYSSFGRIFSNDEVVLKIFESFFYITILTLPLNAVTFVIDGLFKGIGEMKFLRNNLLISTLGVFIPLTFISTQILELSIQGIWISFIGWLICRGGILVWKFRKDFY